MAQMARLVRGKRSTYPSRNVEIGALLLWLWEAAVEPIFQKLGFDSIAQDISRLTVEDNSKLPRVWWIGVGPLAMAPFHAAGDHSPGSTRNTMSQANSSYIPTIKALVYARQKRLQLSASSRLLLINMPTTPDTPAIPDIPGHPGTPAVPGTPASPATASTPAILGTNGTPTIYRSVPIPGTPAKKWKPLHSAHKEVKEIINVASALSTKLDSPAVNEVLEQLPEYQVIHFACHGVSNAHNPSNSHLLLAGNTGSGPGKLTVGDISKMNLKNAQVAYLSACCTADNPSAKLADESIHIASGFQLAGFSHVLATLWASNDDACRQVAVKFYDLLFNGRRNDHRDVSTAFHHAVNTLRTRNLRQPILWAPFIHTGA